MAQCLHQSPTNTRSDANNSAEVSLKFQCIAANQEEAAMELERHSLGIPLAPPRVIHA